MSVPNNHPPNTYHCACHCSRNMWCIWCRHIQNQPHRQHKSHDPRHPYHSGPSPPPPHPPRDALEGSGVETGAPRALVSRGTTVPLSRLPKWAKQCNQFPPDKPVPTGPSDTLTEPLWHPPLPQGMDWSGRTPQEEERGYPPPPWTPPPQTPPPPPPLPMFEADSQILLRRLWGQEDFSFRSQPTPPPPPVRPLPFPPSKTSLTPPPPPGGGIPALPVARSLGLQPAPRDVWAGDGGPDGGRECGWKGSAKRFRAVTVGCRGAVGETGPAWPQGRPMERGPRPRHRGTCTLCVNRASEWGAVRATFSSGLRIVPRRSARLTSFLPPKMEEK